MAKQARTLDTPFRKGERVQTTVTLDDLEEGSSGKVKVANGLGNWRRYWVLFDDGRVRGQVSHDQLVRPNQLEEWRQRELEREQAALVSADEEVEAAAGNGEGEGGATGLAAMIPAHILERSKAAKARLTG